MKLATNAGYSPEMHNGEVRFCVVDTDMGSKISSKKCLNEEQLRNRLERSQRQRDDLREWTPQGGTSGH